MESASLYYVNLRRGDKAAASVDQLRELQNVWGGTAIMWRRVPNLKSAIALAEQMKANGEANWFRGQTRLWPVLSSFVRRKPDERQAAIERFTTFYGWIQSMPALADIASDEDMLLAVAQHYGIPTNLIDFTTEPKVAGFFSAHAAPPLGNDEDVSCIICLDYAELKELCESVKIVSPDMPEPRAIAMDIPELWRIQAQHGIFLDYPFDEGFERHTFDFDRIVFPTERDPSVLSELIPVEDIYPTQKSDLEVLLDQFFMLEKMQIGADAIAPMIQSGQITVHCQAPIPDGIEAECFGSDGLPVHASWARSRLSDWLAPANERWIPISTAPSVHVKYPRDGESRTRIDVLQRQINKSITDYSALRAGPICWALTGVPGDAARITRVLELVWDGLRRWPYTMAEISIALATAVEYGTLVAKNPEARFCPTVAEALAKQCLGDAIEIEIAMEDGSYTRGYANGQHLLETVRDDFFAFVTDRWREQIHGIRNILQIAFNPSRALVFDRLKSVFCTQIVPTQVVLRDEGSGKARLYTPARATRIGLP